MTSSAAAVLAARLASNAAGPSDGHAALYETCAAIVIAVIVVVYFDERVRRALSPRLRGYAIGSLGGILALGVMTPLLALGGFIKDTAASREVVVGYTTLFLVAAFGVGAIRTWGLEDGRRLRNAPAPSSPLPPVPPVPVPSPHLTERERAAEVLGYAFQAVAEWSGAYTLVTGTADKLGGPASAIDRTRVIEFLRAWAYRWAELQPTLVAIVVGYPSQAIRDHTGEFLSTASQALALTVKLATAGESLDEESRSRLADEAAGHYTSTGEAQKALIKALHPEDGNGAKPLVRNRRPARNGTARP